MSSSISVTEEAAPFLIVGNRAGARPDGRTVHRAHPSTSRHTRWTASMSARTSRTPSSTAGSRPGSGARSSPISPRTRPSPSASESPRPASRARRAGRGLGDRRARADLVPPDGSAHPRRTTAQARPAGRRRRGGAAGRHRPRRVVGATGLGAAVPRADVGQSSSFGPRGNGRRREDAWARGRPGPHRRGPGTSGRPDAPTGEGGRPRSPACPGDRRTSARSIVRGPACFPERRGRNSSAVPRRPTLTCRSGARAAGRSAGRAGSRSRGTRASSRP